MNILGISCYYHDAAAALISDGKLVAAAAEERFSRNKHDADFPGLAIEFCLRSGGIEEGDLDYVVFYEKPLLKFDRILMTSLATFPRSAGLFRESMLTWFGEKLWIKGQLVSRLEVPPQKVLFAEHHLAHAASAFLCSPFEDAAILTVDGVGEWATTTIGSGKSDGTSGGSSIDVHHEIKFPHSLGLLYSAFTAYLGFRVNSGEYKVMGMAPYGEPAYVDSIYDMLRIADDGSFRLDLDYFSFPHSAQRAFSNKFVDKLGPARVPESALDLLSKDAEAQRFANIAASVQRVTEEVLLGLAREAHARTGSPHLCLAGGVALNSVANGRILRETPFESIYIQPAAGDAGGALGAALYAHNVLLGQPRSFIMEHAYWGAEQTPDEIRHALSEAGLSYEELDDDEVLVDRTVDSLLAGEVIGWHRGRFEWGPRALGNRSILADPRGHDTKDRVNRKIKFREEFRPFAPVVTEEKASEYFDVDGPGLQYPLRFMQIVVPVAAPHAESMPAITHVNGTARPQSIARRWNPAYHDLVERFGEATGIPVLLNTSFNLRGEPIVNTPEEAINTFLRSDLDLLVLGRTLVRK